MSLETAARDHKPGEYWEHKAVLLYSATTAHTVKSTVFMKGSVHCSVALPHPMHYLSAEMKRQGHGVRNIIETDWAPRSSGLDAGLGLYTAVKLISDTDRGERGTKASCERSGNKVALTLIVPPISLAQLPFPTCQPWIRACFDTTPFNVINLHEHL